MRFVRCFVFLLALTFVGSAANAQETPYMPEVDWTMQQRIEDGARKAEACGEIVPDANDPEARRQWRYCAHTCRLLAPLNRDFIKSGFTKAQAAINVKKHVDRCEAAYHGVMAPKVEEPSEEEASATSAADNNGIKALNNAAHQESVDGLYSSCTAKDYHSAQLCKCATNLAVDKINNGEHEGVTSALRAIVYQRCFD